MAVAGQFVERMVVLVLVGEPLVCALLALRQEALVRCPAKNAKRASVCGGWPTKSVGNCLKPSTLTRWPRRMHRSICAKKLIGTFANSCLIHSWVAGFRFSWRQ